MCKIPYLEISILIGVIEFALSVILKTKNFWKEQVLCSASH
jgi:hypothetical protein